MSWARLHRLHHGLIWVVLVTDLRGCQFDISVFAECFVLLGRLKSPQQESRQRILAASMSPFPLRCRLPFSALGRNLLWIITKSTLTSLLTICSEKQAPRGLAIPDTRLLDLNARVRLSSFRELLFLCMTQIACIHIGFHHHGLIFSAGYLL